LPRLFFVASVVAQTGQGVTTGDTGVTEETLASPAAFLFLASGPWGWACSLNTHNEDKVVYIARMGRTNIVIDESLIRKARKLTRLRTKRQIVDRALDLLVRSESRKGILKYYGSGVWQGDLKTKRRNRV
jgi:Arc/MetJ family transcription regulator